MIKLKRVYEEPEEADGFRILIDRIWPRGFSKERAGIDLWIKEIAPSNELRKWFGHDPGKWPEFRKRFRAELEQNREWSDKLKAETKKHETVTFIYAAKDEEHNNAVALKEFLSS